MTGTLPDWLARMLEVEAADSGQGTRWRLDHSFPWPPWVTLLFVLAVAAVVLALYVLEIGAVRTRTRIALAVTRIAAVGLVLLMIAGWTLSLDRTDLPYAVVMVDVSRSMQVIDRFDDDKFRDEVRRRLEAVELDEPTRLNLAKTLLLENDAELLRAIGRKYKVKLYFVAEAARPQPGEAAELIERLRVVQADGEATRLGDGVTAVLEQLRGSPVAAVILLTDGITTNGKSLVDVAPFCRRKGTPLLTVALGSDRPARDLDLRELLVDEVVFVDQTVDFQVRLAATGFAGRRVDVTLREADSPRILARRSVQLESDSHTERLRLPYRPTEVGDYVYVVEVEPQAEEVDRTNNVRTAAVSVRDRIGVLLVQAQPSYEFRYLKHLLERDTTVDVTTVLQDADLEFSDIDPSSIPVFPVRREELFQYDVIVFGDVNPAFLSQSAMENLRDFVRDSAGGLAMIAGPRFTPLAFANTPLEELLPIDLASARDPQADPSAVIEGFRVVPTELGMASPMMHLADTPEASGQVWSRLPPLYWYLETPRIRRAARVLAEHPTERTADGQPLPLITMQYVRGGKVLFHAVDATYLWRGPHEDTYFARYWLQAIRFLARSRLLGTDRRIEITTDRGQYRRGMPVRIRVRFLDEQQLPGENEPVRVVLERDGANPQTLSLTPNPVARGLYEATVSQLLAEGEYRVRLAGPAPEGTPTTARFSVSPPLGEMERLETDLAEMTTAAELSGGRSYTFATANKLLADLPDGHPVPLERLPSVPLWNFWPVAMVFMVLLITEWALRKRHGML